MDKVYDAVVIGAGPASAAFLCSVSEAYKVAFISKKASRKVCGGLLSPSAVKALSKIGLSVPENVRATPEIEVIRTIDLRDGFTRYYPRNYINVDRAAFDSWLMSLSSEKCDSYWGICTGFERDGELYRVYYVVDNEVKSLLCLSIIGADGANSIIRKQIDSNTNRKDTYVAIQQWFYSSECLGHGGINGFSCVFDNSVSDSYAWSFTKNGKIAFGGAYPKKDSRERFESEKKNLEKCGITFGSPISTEACSVVFGKNEQRFMLGLKKERIYLIGEAAGLISPSSLEGISSALVSGYELGKIFDPNKDVLFKYSRKLTRQKCKLRFKRFKSFVLCSPFLRFLVMRSGITSVGNK